MSFSFYPLQSFPFIFERRRKERNNSTIILTVVSNVQSYQSNQYIPNTEIQMYVNNSSNMIAALKIIYSIPKGTRPYYDIVADKVCNPNCCSKSEKKSYCHFCERVCNANLVLFGLDSTVITDAIFTSSFN